MPAAGRPDLHVIARFLDSMVEPGAGPWSRSQLQRKVRLNYDLFRKYLDVLLERDLVAELPGDPIHVVVTDEGRRVHAELVAWLDDLFGGAL